MMFPITKETIFNDSFKNKYQNTSIINLTNFVIKEKLVDENTVNEIVENLKNVVSEFVINNLSYDLEDDVDSLIKKNVQNVLRYLDDYLHTLNNPYQAIKLLLEGNYLSLIKSSEKQALEKMRIINSKLSKLKNESKSVVKLFPEYNYLLEYILNHIDNINTSYGKIYRLMSDDKDLYCMDDIIDYLNDALIELDILKKFDKNELEKFLKKFTIVDIYKNITLTALYNYIFNCFYKDSKSLELTDNMLNVIYSSVKNGLFDMSDVIDVINNGTLEFTDEEKEYLFKYFLPRFNLDIIKSNNLDLYIRN